MSWKNIVGHEPAIRLLTGQARRGRVAPAYLFLGRSGIGKKMVALEFAKTVSCAAQGGESCDECDSCRQVATGTFSDFKAIAPESETSQRPRLSDAAPRPSGQLGIDQIRELSHWISMIPSAGRFRIGLVDGADQMTEEAAHACLKLLEEPLQQGLLLMIAAASHRLPATLISRCHLVRCIPQGEERVAAFLKEKEGLSAEQCRMLAGLSGGRLGMALAFHRNGLLEQKNAAVKQLLAAFNAHAVEIPLSTSSRAELAQALEWLAAWFRDLLVAHVSGDRHGSLTEEELLARIERTYQVKEAIEQNVSPRIALAVLLAN